MRTRSLLIPGVLIAAACLLYSLRRSPEHERAPSPGGESSLAGEQAAQTDPRAEPRAAQAPPPESVQTVAPREGFASEESHATPDRLLVEWQAPIDFYGKVIDESSNLITGASVQFTWFETPLDDGQKTATSKSDSTGLFSIRGKRGAALEVRVGKDGYHIPNPGFQAFNYALSGHFAPDPAEPVIFQLRKKGQGQELLRLKRNYRVPRDGTPVGIDLASGTAAAGESGHLVVQCRTADQGKRSGQRYDWHCRIAVPNGGLVESQGEFDFLAPEEGYGTSTDIVMPAERPDWRSDVDIKFYYRLPDGRYGRAAFSMVAGGDHFCMIDSLLNPSGSRNLEPLQPGALVHE
jgi:hypothetical protein